MKVMNKRLMRLSGVMLSASFLVSCLGVPALAADSLAKMEKSETVYVITDAAGVPDSVIVSDWLKTAISSAHWRTAPIFRIFRW